MVAVATGLGDDPHLYAGRIVWGVRASLAIVTLISAAALAAMLTRALPTTPASVVVITLDTTRADRLSPYGSMNVSLPHLDRLAREGVVFDQATSVAPLTLPSHTSLFTGQLPPPWRTEVPSPWR